MYNPKKHHRHSIRLKNYDYNDGFYFVTICCQNRACIFGEIKNGIMMPNEYGKIAINEWLKTESIRSNVKLYEFVVMPNHIHGILEINHIPDTTITAIEEITATVGARRALPSTLPYQPNRFQNQGKNTLSSIIGSYKSAVSKQIHETGFIGSIWQRNYYEQIIRNEHSYQNVSQYITNNPMNWQNDKLYKGRGKASLA